ncbi:MAG: hypothetical protein KBD21_05495 [Candidatus Pacebacteria bacterium]|nr:hypothetical protein [Candidatus Paceibacterota bacterium]
MLTNIACKKLTRMAHIFSSPDGGITPRPAPSRGREHPMHERGTLLIEMLASFAIISVTLVIVADVFMTSNRASAIALRQIEVSDAIAFALADITREAKVSDTYTEPDTETFRMIRVKDLNGQADDPVTYTRVVDVVTNKGRLQKTIDTAGTAVDLTPPNVVIDSFVVTVTTVLPPDGVTRALITLTAHHEEGPNDPPVYIQTTLTERMF